MRVLILEDDPAQRLLLKSIFQRYDPSMFDVSESDTLAEGLDIMRTKSPDVVLLDLSLKDSGNRIETLKIFMALATAIPIPVVICSQDQDETLMQQALAEGVVQYVVKPPLESEVLDGISLAARQIAKRYGNENGGDVYQHIADKLTEMRNIINTHK